MLDTPPLTSATGHERHQRGSAEGQIQTRVSQQNWSGSTDQVRRWIQPGLRFGGSSDLDLLTHLDYHEIFTEFQWT